VARLAGVLEVAVVGGDHQRDVARQRVAHRRHEAVEALDQAGRQREVRAVTDVIGHPHVQVGERVVPGDGRQAPPLARRVRRAAAGVPPLEPAAVEVGRHRAAGAPLGEPAQGHPRRPRRHHGGRRAGAPVPALRPLQRLEVDGRVGVGQRGPAGPRRRRVVEERAGRQ